MIFRGFLLDAVLLPRLSVASGPSRPAVSCPLPKGVSPPPALRLRPRRRPQPPAPALLNTLACLLLAWKTQSGTGSTKSPSRPLSRDSTGLQVPSLLKRGIQKWVLTLWRSFAVKRVHSCILETLSFKMPQRSLFITPCLYTQYLLHSSSFLLNLFPFFINQSRL